MEEKKLDLNSVIGFILLFGILFWIMYQNQPSAEQLAAEKAKKELAQKQANQTQKTQIAVVDSAVSATDSTQLNALRSTLGAFAYSATLPSAHPQLTTLENDVLRLQIDNKGGYITEAVLKNHERFKKGSGQLVTLIKNNNSRLNLSIKTKDNRVLQTQDLYFEPSLTRSGDAQILTLRLKTAPDAYLEYRYVLHANNYMLDFDIRSENLNRVLNTSQPVDLQWDMKTFRNEKSISYENRYTDIRFEYEDGKDNYTGQSKHAEETPEKVSFVAFKQHFFSTILCTQKPFEKAILTSDNLVNNEELDTVYTKQLRATIPLAYQAGELNSKMNLYLGPTDYHILKSYDKNLDKIIPLGWGIFGWINKFIFIPLFGFLSSYIAYGLAIIIFTIIIKIAMSPITYKSFLSQAKMKVLRPEINELNEKFKKDPLKKQQETMQLYNKAGVSPLAGCIPALIQLPFMYASFQFFPSAFELRHKSFLWADDLSSFDEIVTLPFRIPLYGAHISLFPILAAVAIFFYMKMTSGDQQMAAPQQEGMPDMTKIMKMMIYISPIMMLIFFNNYGSGLSLYNFISNLITIGIMFVIKNYIVDPDKIHAQIQQNKLRAPKKQSKFQQKLQQMMEEAEAQKATQKKNKK